MHDAYAQTTESSGRALRRFLVYLSFALLTAASFAFAQGARTSAPVDLPPNELKPGEFIWVPEVVPAGPLVMVISLDEQLAYVYRNGLRIGVSTVSTGKEGKETPTGVFTILQKHKDHKSNLYNDASMPFMQRLTWDGIALHAGTLPGYPASHGCVRLPYEFARRLFDVTTFGMTVVIAAEAKQNAQLAHPGLFSPVVAESANAPDVPWLSWVRPYRWTPEKSPDGPLTILISTTDQHVLVIRNGIEIGRAKIGIAGEPLFGTQAYVLLAGDSGTPSMAVPGKPGRNWQTIPVPGYAAMLGATRNIDEIGRVTVPPEFAALVYDQLVPGTTLVLTDASILPKAIGKTVTILSTDDEESEAAPAVDASQR